MYSISLEIYIVFILLENALENIYLRKSKTLHNHGVKLAVETRPFKVSRTSQARCSYIQIMMENSYFQFLKEMKVRQNQDSIMSGRHGKFLWHLTKRFNELLSFYAIAITFPVTVPIN